jgi:hypothetical protein
MAIPWNFEIEVPFIYLFSYHPYLLLNFFLLFHYLFLRIEQPRNLCSIPGRGKSFFLIHNFQTDCGAHLASYSVRTGSSFPWVKQPGPEADHSTPSNAQVKNEYSNASTHSLCLHGVYRDIIGVIIPYIIVISTCTGLFKCQLILTVNKP